MTLRQPFHMRVAFLFLWLFVFTIPIEDSVHIAGLGTISKLAGMIALGVGAIALGMQGKIRLPGLVHVLLGAFVLWSAMTLRWSISPDDTQQRIVTYVELLCLTLLVWEFCPDTSHVLSLMEAFVIGCLAPAFDTVTRYLLGEQTFYKRYATEGFDPNDLALMLALSLPMAYYLSLRRTGGRRWLYLFQMVAVIVAILLTASRGGTVAMAVGLSLVVWTMPILPARRRAVLIAVLAVMIPTAAVLVPASSWRRLSTLASEVSKGTLNSRTVLWKIGWDAFGGKAFQGVGSGAYPEVVAPVLGRPWGFTAVAHNSFISVLVETGLIGFAIFLSALAAMASRARRMPWLERRFWLTVLATWTIGVCSLTWEQRKPTWLIFALLAAHAGVLVRVNRPRRAASSEEFHETPKTAEVA
jgi:O-antigen ligase